MFSKQFHSMNAYVDNYDDGTIVFRSYDTPIVVRHNMQWIMSPAKYSSSTTRQTNRFLHEEGINVTMVEHDYFVKVLNILGIYRGWA